MKPRDTYKYILKINDPQDINSGFIKGCTNDLGRKLQEYRVRYPFSTIGQVGRKTTRKAALKWVKA